MTDRLSSETLIYNTSPPRFGDGDVAFCALAFHFMPLSRWFQAPDLKDVAFSLTLEMCNKKLMIETLKCQKKPVKYGKKVLILSWRRSKLFPDVLI